MLRHALRAALTLLLALPVLHAAGPRWVASSLNYTGDGQPIVWYQNNVSYYIDRGPLSSSVDNATAARIVDAAAQVWNIQYSNLVLSNGGALAEDVSAANVYLGSSGPIWPSDVDSSNYTAKQIAVLFDSDGTLIDMMLGTGASSPSSCRQNAVVENVDKFIQSGRIAHAIILINGRCAGPATEQQLQLQYQLMRIFGRVIGLAWSQVNDNVFTGAPAPNYQQQLHWPIMHPIDIVCGTYTYQCLPSPFTLRPDDMCSVRLLYGVGVYVTTDGQMLSGTLYFPTGQGMDGVNMVATRQGQKGTYGQESWQTTSAVTGAFYRQSSGNPVTGALASVQGSLADRYQGNWTMAQVPVISGYAWNDVVVSAETINPLYRGSYSVGPSGPGILAPSGSVASLFFTQVARYGGKFANQTVSDAANSCATGADGTEAAPAPVATTGQWTGRLCGWQHNAWGSFTVQPGRTATLEIMAQDENGAASITKLRPVTGFWHGQDRTGILPTVAAAGVPFNGRQTGTTQLTSQFTVAGTVRFVIADQRGKDRPDFNYSARLLYADTVSPARLGANGGTVTISGLGFQPGNTVTIGGVAATIASLTANQIVATAPSLAAIGGTTTADVVVTDLRTGGTTAISAGLAYSSTTSDVLTVVTAPPLSANVGSPVPFAVRLTNGSAAVAGGTVTFRVVGGVAVLAPCGAAACTQSTDAAGLAQVRVTASNAGIIALQATTNSGAQVSAQFTAVAPSQTVTAIRPFEYVAATPGAPFTPSIVLFSGGERAANVPVQWTVLSGAVTLGAGQALLQTRSAADGSATVPAFANLQPGDQATVQACAWSSVCTAITLAGVSTDALDIQAVSGDAQVVPSDSRLSQLTLRVVGPGGNAVAGASAGILQKVTGWQPACPATGRCAVPPMYGTARAAAVSDDTGQFTIDPLQYDGTAADTHIAATTGSHGFFAVTLSKQP